MSVKVSSLVWYSTIQGSAKRLVLLALADRADDQGLCRPGIKNLMLKTGLANSSVRKALNELVAEHLLAKRPRKKVGVHGGISRDTNAYRISLETLRSIQHPNDDDENSDLAELFDDDPELATPPPRIGAPLPSQSADPSAEDRRTPPPVVGANTSLGTSVNTPPPTAQPVDNFEEEEFPKELKSFVANLDYGSQFPSRAEFVRIAKATKRLYGKVNPHDLKTRIQANMRGVESPVAVYITRLNELTLDDFKLQKPSPRRRNWCQQADKCDPNTRRVIDDNGFITREPCPACTTRVESGGLVYV